MEMQKCPNVKKTNSTSVTTTISSDQEELKGRREKIENRRVLKKRLKVVSKVNEDLEEAIQTKNGEINELKKAIASLNDVINSVPLTELKNGSSIASTKIVDLNRKNRQLKCDLDSTKSKNSKLEAKIQRLEQEKEAIKKDEQDGKKGSSGSIPSAEYLQEQLHMNKQKLFEALNQNVELKNSLKLAQKCIQQEIGENVNLNTLVASSSNWRGRSQQIISLQMKVKELQDKLDNYHHHNHHNFQMAEEGHCAVRKLESQRRAEIDDLNKQLSFLKQTIEEFKNRISALKLRNKTLVEEVSNYKIKSMGLLEQTGNNDSSIANLNEKLHMQKYHYENKLKEMQNTVKAIEQSKSNLRLEIEQHIAKNDNMKKMLQDKEIFIEELQNTIHRLEEDLKSVCGNFLFNCRNLNKSDFMAILEALEVEKRGLADYNETLHQRVIKEREKSNSLMENLTKSKIKTLRCESKIKELQRELEASQEKRKRNQRIQEYSSNLSSSRLTGFIFENSTFGLDSQSSLGEKDDNLLCREELRNKLEIANEKIIALDEKLNYLAVEHNEDVKTFHQILADSKSSIVDTIQSFKQGDVESDFDVNGSTMNLDLSKSENDSADNE